MILAVNSGLLVFNVVIIALLLIWLVAWGIQVLRRKRYATVIDQDDFQKGMRKAQVIDLRQPDDFRKGHILGARSLPYVYIKQQYGELRSDLPVYMYDQGMTLSTQAAAFLGKKGFKQLYILKGGYLKWEGKTKKAKY